MDWLIFIASFVLDGFMKSIQDVKDSALLNQLTEAIKENDYDKVFMLLNATPGTFRPLTATLDRAFEVAADSIVKDYPKYIITPSGKMPFRFNILNPAAQKFLRDKSSEMVTRISEDIRVVVRNTMETGMQAGRNPRNTALDLVGRYDRAEGRRTGGVIGLADNQAAWVEATRRQLADGDEAYFNKKLRNKRYDAMVRESIASGKPLTAAQITKLTDLYADSALKFRGDTIARTESLEALSTADYQATQQVVASGGAREKDVEREWMTARDNSVRHTHEEMHGQKRGLNEPFDSPSGARLLFPRDRSLGADANEIIDCRCRVKTTIDWIGAALND